MKQVCQVEGENVPLLAIPANISVHFMLFLRDFDKFIGAIEMPIHAEITPSNGT